MATMFSQRHYIAIAKLLANRRPSDVYHVNKVAWALMRQDFADMFANDNPKFDRNRFYEACNGETRSVS